MSTIETTIDLLEELIENSKSIPFVNALSINRDEINDILVEMRGNIPEEIRDAKRVVSECEDYINNAKKEAEAIIKQAEFEAGKLVSDHEVYLRAVKEAEEIKSIALEEANNGIVEAFIYVDKVLEDTGELITKIHNATEEQHRHLSSSYEKAADLILKRREYLRQ